MLGLEVILEVAHGVLFPLIGEVDEVTSAEVEEGDSSGRELMRGSVTIMGASQATVTVDCSETLARRLGGAMFDAEPSTLSNGDVADALGEIANIIGSNIKALLPGPSRLGFPEIEWHVYDKPSAIALEQSFLCTGEPFRVCVTGANRD